MVQVQDLQRQNRYVPIAIGFILVLSSLWVFGAMFDTGASSGSNSGIEEVVSDGTGGDSGEGGEELVEYRDIEMETVDKEEFASLLERLGTSYNLWPKKWQEPSACRRMRCVWKRGGGLGGNLVSFFLAGAAKSATSDMWHSLASHSSISVSEAKEAHFLDRSCRGNVENLLDSSDSKCTLKKVLCTPGDGRAELLRRPWAQMCKKDSPHHLWGKVSRAFSELVERGDEFDFGDGCEKGMAWKLTLDGTPGYLQTPQFPEWWASINPNASVLLMLRHPVERTLSSAKFQASRQTSGSKRVEFVQSALLGTAVTEVLAERLIEYMDDLMHASTVEDAAVAMGRIICMHEKFSQPYHHRQHLTSFSIIGSLYVPSILNILRGVPPTYLTLGGFYEYSNDPCTLLRKVARSFCIELDDAESGDESIKPLIQVSETESLSQFSSCGGYHRVTSTHASTPEPQSDMEQQAWDVIVRRTQRIFQKISKPTTIFLQALEHLGATVALDPVQLEGFGPEVQDPSTPLTAEYEASILSNPHYVKRRKKFAAMAREEAEMCHDATLTPAASHPAVSKINSKINAMS